MEILTIWQLTIIEVGPIPLELRKDLFFTVATNTSHQIYQPNIIIIIISIEGSYKFTRMQ